MNAKVMNAKWTPETEKSGFDGMRCKFIVNVYKLYKKYY